MSRIAATMSPADRMTGESEPVRERRQEPISKKPVAIACQGGGSHAAFAAGILCELLTSRKFREDYRLVALSGTSGGAVCAALAWSGLIRGGPEAAKQALEGFWHELACYDLNYVGTQWMTEQFWLKVAPLWWFHIPDSVTNRVLVNFCRYFPGVEAFSPLMSSPTRFRMKWLLENHLQLPELGRVTREKGRFEAEDAPKLFLGATDICEGFKHVFHGGNLKELVDAIIASAAIPPLFQPVAVRGHSYWDGLFSINPPIEELTNLETDNRPREIWIIQINPDTCAKVPVTPGQIIDRRNELSGNLALHKSLRFIDVVNDLLPQLSEEARRRYQEIRIKIVPMEEDLDFASKYERGVSHIDHLMEAGRHCAGEFFEDSSVWHRPHGSAVRKASLSPQRARQLGAEAAREQSVGSPVSAGR